MNEMTEHVWTQAEIQEKHHHEKIIQTNITGISESIEVLKRKKLYMIEYDTWEEYCTGHWGWTPQRISQLVDFDVVVKTLPEKVKQLVTTEASARALKPVPAAQRPKVLEQAQKAAQKDSNGHVNARHISEAAAKVVPPKPKETPKQQFFDKTGFEIPENLHNLFLRTPEVMGHLQNLSAIRAMLRRVDETRDPLWLPVNKSMTGSQVDQLYAEIKQALPYAVCIYCQGRDDTMTHCTACKGRGVLSEHFWRTAVPEELKSVRDKANKK